MNAPTRTTESTALTSAADQLANLPANPYVSGQDLVLHGDYFDKVDRLANIMSKAKGAVPRHLLGNPGACFSVALTAVRANFDPFGVARKTWMGPDETIKYESQLVIALINNSGLLAERLRWEYFGDWSKILGRFERRQTKKKDNQGNLRTDANGEVATYLAKTWSDADEKGLGVRCIARLKGEAEPRITELLMAQAITRNSTLWVEDPKQQIGYLSGFRWGRLHTPEAIMGIYSPDEDFEPPRDMGPADVVGADAAAIDPALVKRAQDAANKGRVAYTEFWKNCTHMDRALLSEKSDVHEKMKLHAAAVDDSRTVDNKPGATPAPSPTPTPTPSPSAAPVAAAADAAAVGQGDSPFVATYAAVLDRMLTAARSKNQIAFDIAADWIPEIADEEQRKELEAKRDELLAEMKGTQQ
ncbi:MAG: hypothetical protein EOO24_14505 [Comamonadaceae bacterium]|nr:MAG: hypothetical protein EOO24_14505 [Comamonadaceae bacterium]